MAASIQPANPANPVSATPRLLVVESEEVLLAEMRDRLRRAGYAVAATRDLAHARELLENQRFAVVLADLQSPELVGIELLLEAKKLQPEAVRVLMSPPPPLSVMLEAINRVEIGRFLLKPWPPEDLLRIVQEAVQHHERMARDRLVLKTTLAMNDTLNRLNQSLAQKLAVSPG